MKRTILPSILLGLSLNSAHANLLDELYQQALENDAQYAAARAQFEASMQARPQLRASLLPSLTANGSYSRQREETKQASFPGFVPGTTYSNATNASLRLIQPLFDWSAFARARQIDERVAQAQTSLSGAEQELILRVTSAYFDWLAAEDNVRFAVAEKKAIAQQLKQAKSRYEVGLSAITDVQEAQARFDLSNAQEIAAAGRLRATREALRVITSQRPSQPVALSTPLETQTPEPGNPDQWVEQALANNLQLKATELASRIAKEQLRERQSAYLPSLNLVAEHAYSDTLDSPNFGREAENSTVSLQMQLPLFAGGANHARAKEGRYLYEKSLADLEHARRQAEQISRDAYDGVVTGQAQVSALEQAVRSSEVARDAIEAGFNAGTRTSVDVLNAQRELFRAQRDLARARYDYLLSVLRLKQAVGGLNAADLQAIDELLVSKS